MLTVYQGGVLGPINKTKRLQKVLPACRHISFYPNGDVRLTAKVWENITATLADKLTFEEIDQLKRLLDGVADDD